MCILHKYFQKVPQKSDNVHTWQNSEHLQNNSITLSKNRRVWIPTCFSQHSCSERDSSRVSWRLVSVIGGSFLRTTVTCMPLFPREQQIGKRFFLKNGSLGSVGFQTQWGFAEPTRFLCLQNYFLGRMQPKADKQRGARWLKLFELCFISAAYCKTGQSFLCTFRCFLGTFVSFAYITLSQIHPLAHKWRQMNVHHFSRINLSCHVLERITH